MSSLPSIQQICLGKDGSKNAATATNLPQGLLNPNGKDSMRAFMNDNTKLLTFFSNSLLTLSWTTAVTYYTLNSYGVVAVRDGSSDLGGVFGASFMFVYFAGSASGTHGVGSENSYAETTESAHEFDRTVTVSLEDDDIGMHRIIAYLFNIYLIKSIT